MRLLPIAQAAVFSLLCFFVLRTATDLTVSIDLESSIAVESDGHIFWSIKPGAFHDDDGDPLRIKPGRNVYQGQVPRGVDRLRAHLLRHPGEVKVRSIRVGLGPLTLQSWGPRAILSDWRPLADLDSLRIEDDAWVALSTGSGPSLLSNSLQELRARIWLSDITFSLVGGGLWLALFVLSQVPSPTSQRTRSRTSLS